MIKMGGLNEGSGPKSDIPHCPWGLGVKIGRIMGDKDGG